MDAIHVLQDPFPAPEVARARTAFDSAESQIVAEQYGTSRAPVRFAYDDGTKFAGGYGVTKLLAADYWTLRARSSQLFETNIYARGVIRRLVTNVINTGLSLEATPEEKILGKEEDELADWSEMVENRFQLWCDSPRLCDQAELKTFGAIQAEAYREALIEGDVLVVLRQDPRTGLPRLQLIKGSNVRTPWGITEDRAKRDQARRRGRSERATCRLLRDAEGRHSEALASVWREVRVAAGMARVRERQAARRRSRQAAALADLAVVAGGRSVSGQHAT
jgi:hypothetical protein